jgi:hypothetical protein
VIVRRVLRCNNELLITIILGHSLTGNNTQENKTAALQHCLLMQRGSVYIKRWKWTERKLKNQVKYNTSS